MGTKLYVRVTWTRDEVGREHEWKSMQWGYYEFLFPPREGDWLDLYYEGESFNVIVRKVSQRPLPLTSREADSELGDEPSGWLETDFVNDAENHHHAQSIGLWEGAQTPPGGNW